MVLCACAARADGQAYFPHKTIALTGWSAPQTETGTVFDQIGTPTLNSRGEVAFSAFLSGPRVTSNLQGVWIADASGAQIVARANDVAAGTSRRFIGFDDAWMLGDGQAAFKGIFGDLTAGIWAGRANAVSLVAATGQPAPGMPPGTTFTEIDGHVLTPSGKVAFEGVVSVGADSIQGIWMGPLDGPVPMIRTGDHAPQLPADFTFKTLYLSALNETEGMLFAGEMAGAGLTNLTDGAMFAGRPGNFVPVARERGPAPGTTDDTNYLTIFNPAMTDKGAIAYRATFTGPQVDASNVIGLYAGSPGHIQLIARRGWQAAGMPQGVTYHSPGAPAFDRATGYFAFASTLDTPEADPSHHSALYIGSPESFDLLAYTGMAVPGASDATFSSFGSIVLNSNGQVAFIAYITGTGIDAGRNNEGIWATDLNGQLHLVARTGVPFALSGTDSAVPTVLSIASSDNYDIGPFVFNDSGQLVFHAEFFGSREGVFLVSTVPEPSVFWGMVVAGIVLLRRGSRAGW